jgi:hypothetical protein
MLDFALDHFNHSLAHINRRYEQRTVIVFVRIAGQKIKQIARVFADVLVGGEQTQIGVMP